MAEMIPKKRKFWLVISEGCFFSVCTTKKSVERDVALNRAANKEAEIIPVVRYSRLKKGILETMDLEDYFAIRIYTSMLGSINDKLAIDVATEGKEKGRHLTEQLAHVAYMRADELIKAKRERKAGKVPKEELSKERQDEISRQVLREKT